MMQTMITGANRGLGLEFVRQCAARGDRVLACCRRPESADELRGVGGDVRVLALDVSEPESVVAAASEVEGPVDFLVNNAGVYGGERSEPQSVAAADPETMAWVYRVNVVGPALLMQALADRLPAASRVVNVSSGYGSIERAAGDWPVHYCCSKAALNMLTRIAGSSLEATVVAMNPGWVQTDMGGSEATLTPKDSIAGMLEVVAGLSKADSGTFRRYDGSHEPW